MTAQFKPSSYADRNNLDIIEQLIARKNMFVKEGKQAALTFEQEYASAIDLEGAPLFLFDSAAFERAPEDSAEDDDGEAQLYDVEDLAQQMAEEEAKEDATRQTAFRHCKMTCADFYKAVGCYTGFFDTALSFASFYCTDLRRARFERCNLTGADFEDADLEETSFCLDDPDILNANFKGARNMDKARFYVIRDGYRLPVYQVAVDAQGRLRPDKDAKLPVHFNEGAEYGIRFSGIYETLKVQADQNAALIAAMLHEAKENGNIPEFTPAMQKFLALHQLPGKPAPRGTKRSPA